MVRRELTGYVGLLVTRNDHDPGGREIKPVHRSEATRSVCSARRCRRSRRNPVASCLAQGPSMPEGFVDDEEVGVLVNARGASGP